MRTKLRCSNCVLTGTGYFTKKTLSWSQAATWHPQSRSTKGSSARGRKGWRGHHQHWKTSLKVSTLKKGTFQASQDPTQIWVHEYCFPLIVGSRNHKTEGVSTNKVQLIAGYPSGRNKKAARRKRPNKIMATERFGPEEKNISPPPSSPCSPHPAIFVYTYHRVGSWPPTPNLKNHRLWALNMDDQSHFIYLGNDLHLPTAFTGGKGSKGIKRKVSSKLGGSHSLSTFTCSVDLTWKIFTLGWF